MSALLFVLLAVAGIYIAFDIYRNRKGIKGFSFVKFKDALVNARFSDYVWGFVWFLAIFLFARGFALMQSEAQNCQVWESQMPLMAQYEGNIKWEGDVRDLEQERSYNYYRRYFDEFGGRPANVNINCSWDFGRFKKNIVLDYNERNKIW